MIQYGKNLGRYAFQNQGQQLLQAIREKEKETQEKVDQKKAAAVRSRQKEKNW